MSGAGRHVVLMHGLGPGYDMLRLADHLTDHGWKTHAPRLTPSFGQRAIDLLARDLAEVIEREIPAGEQFDLVGFSMGGLIVRYYMQRLGGLERVRRLITVSAPHRGTLLAWCIPNAACRQMRGGSAFLRDLDGDIEKLGQVRHTTMWTPFDLLIVPARSSRIAGTREVMLRMVFHPMMVVHPDCLEAITTELEAA